MQLIRLAVGGRSDVALFRNSVGKLQDKRTDAWIQYGLCKGSADLVGWRSVKITQAMVGRRVAVFTAIEVKAPGASTERKHLEEQTAFINAVLAAGGLAGFADNPSSANRIVDAL